MLSLAALPFANIPPLLISLSGSDSLSFGMILLILFIALGVGKILTGIAVWRFLKLKEKDKSE